MGEKLGKGLEAIFGGSVEDLVADIQNGKVDTSNNGVSEIEIKKIKPNPHQPRKTFNETELQELADSIKVHGVFNPIIVVEDVNGYVLVMGERRLRASEIAGKDKIPAIVVQYDDKQMMELALLENTQRSDLNIIEIAEAYKKLIDKYDYTQEELANRVGKSREYIANALRLLRLSKEIQQMVINGDLKNGHVRAILALDDDQQLLVAKKAVKENLSVRKVEQLVKEIKEGKTNKKVHNDTSSQYDNITNMMQEKLATKVTISNKQIVIKFDGNDDLNRILELLDCLEEE